MREVVLGSKVGWVGERERWAALAAVALAAVVSSGGDIEWDHRMGEGAGA
jgi:hypothetical protein